MKKAILAILILMVCTGLLFARGAQPADETVQMYKWGTPLGQDNWDELDDLITANTGVEVDLIAPPGFVDYQTKVATLLSSGDTSIDIFDIDEYITYGNILGGFFEPLNDLFTREDLAAYPKSYMDNLATYQGDIIGVPYGFSWFPFYLNKRMLDEAGLAIPATSAEWLEVTQALTSDGTWGYGDGWGKGYITNTIQYLMYVLGGDYFDWENPGTQATIKLMHDMINVYEITPAAILAEDYGVLMEKLLDGTYASSITWDWIVGQAVGRGIFGTEIIIADPVKWTDDPNSDITLMGAWLYTLNASSVRKDASKEVLRFMVSAEAASAVAKLGAGAVPLRSDTWDQAPFNDVDVFPALPMLQDLNAQDRLWPRPMAGRMSDIMDSLENSAYEYFNGSVDLDEAMERGQRELDRLLAELIHFPLSQYPEAPFAARERGSH